LFPAMLPLRRLAGVSTWNGRTTLCISLRQFDSRSVASHQFDEFSARVCLSSRTLDARTPHFDIVRRRIAPGEELFGAHVSGKLRQLASVRKIELNGAFSYVVRWQSSSQRDRGCVCRGEA